MTNEFTDLELGKDISEMEGDEAKETLSEFMESHKQNSTAYDEVQTEYEDRIDELEAEKEELEETVGTIKSEYAEKAAEEVKLTADVIEEKFTFSEIQEILDEVEDAETEYSEEEETYTQFAQREERGKTPPDDGRVADRDKAEKLLGKHGNFPTSD